MAKNMTKEEWVELLRETGLDAAAMRRWHTIFEQRFPEAHQGFMEWLAMSEDEIAKVRAASKNGFSQK
jgi:crotonobetainyl-CoA:carnitine CoA-transferase CaiB-like acyl-CoA transferase